MFGGEFTKIIIPAEERGNRISALSVRPESLCDVWTEKNRFLLETLETSDNYKFIAAPTCSKALFVSLKLLAAHAKKKCGGWNIQINTFSLTIKCYVKIKIVPSSVFFVIAVNTLLPKDAGGFHLLILTGRQH